MLHLAVNGALGRMGRRVLAIAAQQAADISVTAAVDRTESGAYGHAVGTQVGAPAITVPLTAELPPDATIDVVIDFTTPEATVALASACVQRKIALVSGSTGMTPEQAATLDSAAGDIAVLHATNFSVGIALLAQLTKQAASVLGLDFAIEITETHHDQKADAPSGTALTLAEFAASGAKLDPEAEGTFIFGRHGRGDARPRPEIGIHALRGGDVVGEHTVHFFGPAERLELTHRAGSRDLFAAGAVRAARWLQGRAPGRYTVADMLQDLLSKATT